MVFEDVPFELQSRFLFEFYICIYIWQILQKLNAHPCKPKKVRWYGHGSKTDVNYTNKLGNKWYSWRQTSTILYLLIQKIRLRNILCDSWLYWINSIKIDQMPRREIYLFLLAPIRPLSFDCCRCYFPVLNERIHKVLRANKIHKHKMPQIHHFIDPKPHFLSIPFENVLFTL